MKLLSAAPASFLSVACDLHDAAGAVVGAGVVVVELVWAAAPQARASPAASETAPTAMERGDAGRNDTETSFMRLPPWAVEPGRRWGEAGDRWWGAQSVVNAGVAV